VFHLKFGHASVTAVEGNKVASAFDTPVKSAWWNIFVERV
jgi:hypothetical protein